MSSSSSVSSMSSVTSGSDDQLQRWEVKRQRLAAKLQRLDDKINARKQRSAEMEARRKKARECRYSLRRVVEDDGEVKPVTKRKRISGPPACEEEIEPISKKRLIASSLSEREEEEVREEPLKKYAGPSPPISRTPSLTSLVSLTSLASLSSTASPPSSPAPSPPASTRRRGRPKKKVSTRAKDALGRFLPDPSRVRPTVVRRKRRTELELLLDYSK